MNDAFFASNNTCFELIKNKKVKEDSISNALKYFE